MRLLPYEDEIRSVEGPRCYRAAPKEPPFRMYGVPLISAFLASRRDLLVRASAGEHALGVPHSQRL